MSDNSNAALPDKRYDCALVWFRRDLRDYDHSALYHALRAARRVYCAFVFDTEILDRLSDKADRRVEFIWRSVQELQAKLAEQGGGLIVRHGAARHEIPALAKQLGADTVYANRDYEPAAMTRDAAVKADLGALGIGFHTFKDQVIFETDEVLSNEGRPYSVFTAYENAWLKKLAPFHLQPYAVEQYASALAQPQTQEMPSLPSLGFVAGSLQQPAGMSGASRLFAEFRGRIAHYHETRDFPGTNGPSYLSAHLRFGTISIRTLARQAWELGGGGAGTWLSELIWRDFYFMILHHHPRVAMGHCFKPEYDAISWPGTEQHFQAWCAGRTGYPLVDAAMRQLNQTGYMHNRLRMVTASFLAKDLLVDWRRGEDYFARKLLDFDLAANNGGWQWAASTGCDAQPWFRIFNPVTQSEKSDPEGRFIRKYVPELAACSEKEIHAPWKMPAERQRALGITIGQDYPAPIVDHAAMREAALALYRNAAQAPR